MIDQNCFVLCWNDHGLECVIDVNQEHSEATLQALQGQKFQSLDSKITVLMLRTRFNSHRNYEIYSVLTDPSITVKMLVQMFETDSNAAAELVRSHGIKIHQ